MLGRKLIQGIVCADTQDDLAVSLWGRFFRASDKVYEDIVQIADQVLREQEKTKEEDDGAISELLKRRIRRIAMMEKLNEHCTSTCSCCDSGNDLEDSGEHNEDQ